MIAETGSLTAAARHLGLSQPALGLQIKDLERELGCQLLTRHARGMRLTDAGEIFLRHASKTIDAAERARDSVSEFSDRHQEIWLGITPTAGRVLIADLLTLLATKAPRLKLYLRQDQSRDLLEALAAGTLSAAFCYDPPANDELTAVQLYAEDLVLVSAKPVTPSRTATTAFGRLSDIPLVLAPRPQMSRAAIETAAHHQGVTLDVVAEIAPTSLKREILVKRDIATIVPFGLFRDDILNGRLHASSIHPPITLVMSLVMKRSISGTHRTRLAEAAHALVRTVITDGQYGWRYPPSTDTR